MGQGLGSKYLGEFPHLCGLLYGYYCLVVFNLETDTVLIDFGFSPNVLDAHAMFEAKRFYLFLGGTDLLPHF